MAIYKHVPMTIVEEIIFQLYNITGNSLVSGYNASVRVYYSGWNIWQILIWVKLSIKTYL